MRAPGKIPTPHFPLLPGGQQELREALAGGDVACLRLRLDDVDDAATRRSAIWSHPKGPRAAVAAFNEVFVRYGRAHRAR